MLPSIRDEEYLYNVPKYDHKKKDFKNFEHELRGYHQLFKGCFHRIEARQPFYNYIIEQFSNLERKSIELIALAIKGSKVREMQNFISGSPLDDEQMKTFFHPNMFWVIQSTEKALILSMLSKRYKG